MQYALLGSLARKTHFALLTLSLGVSDIAVAQAVLKEEAVQAQTRTDAAEGPIRILIGPEHVTPGEARYAVRIEVGGQAELVELSRYPQPEPSRSRGRPPSLQDLINNPFKQAELDRSAKLGDWVTPPAARR